VGGTFVGSRISQVSVPFAHVVEGSNLGTAFYLAPFGRGSMRLALATSDSNIGAVFVLAFLAWRAMFGTKTCAFRVFSAPWKATLAALRSMRDADTALNDAVFAPNNGAQSLMGLGVGCGWRSRSDPDRLSV